MDSGWIVIQDSPIAIPDEPIIVWHVYSGVMVETREHAVENQFMTHWRAIDNGAWIDARERPPTKEDADIYNCVISLNQWGEISMAGWHRFEREHGLIAWQHPPDPPDKVRDLQNNT